MKGHLIHQAFAQTGHWSGLRLRCGLLVLWLLCRGCLTPPNQAADLPLAFDEANKLYEKGKHAEAAQAYQQLINSGRVSPALYFNLGNAFFKDGQIGRAIVNYRLAARLAPRDPDIRANLQFARDSVTGGTLAPNRWQRGLSLLTLNELSLFAVSALWLWFLLLILGQLRREWKKSLRGYTATAGVMTSLAALWLGAAIHNRFDRSPAIVIAREAVVRYGPLEASQSFYTLRDGAEVMVLDRKNDWLQVSDALKRVGWVQSKNVFLFLAN